MEKKQINIPLILGPTSSGKTSLALEIARETKAEIISADSRQIYKYMDIGTGKIPLNSEYKIQKKDTHWVVNDVIIWGYDLVTPDKFFSAYDFKKFATNIIKERHRENKKIYIVGGTGFYIDILSNRVSPFGVEPNFPLREKLKNYSIEQLRSKLRKLNLEEYNKIDINNPVRLIRAIEKFTPGQDISKEEVRNFDDITFKYIGLYADRDFLYKRVDSWLDSIWDNGLIQEVEDLIKKYPYSDKLNGLVYKSAVNYIVNKDISEKEKAKFNLHSYIRRQQTYFNKNKEIEWIDIQQDNKKQKVYNMINE